MQDAPRHVVGIDLGGTKVLAGRSDQRGSVDQKVRLDTSSVDAESVISTLIEALRSLSVDGSFESIAAVACGIPSTIDHRTGLVVQAANLPLRDLPLADELRARTGITTIVLENDANVAAVAEQRVGAGIRFHADHLLMVTLGTGVGGGMVIDGTPYSGSIGGGGEFGHVSIDRNGPPCTAPACNGIGCVEGLCSGTALARRGREHIAAHPDGSLAVAAAGEDVDAEFFVDRARSGDGEAAALIEELAVDLGVAIAGWVNLFNPEAVTLGGGLGSQHDLLLPTVRRIVADRSLSPARDMVHIVPAECGEAAGMVGAIELAWDAVGRHT